jgi:hypothetical protein
MRHALLRLSIQVPLIQLGGAVTQDVRAYPLFAKHDLPDFGDIGLLVSRWHLRH